MAGRFLRVGTSLQHPMAAVLMMCTGLVAGLAIGEVAVRIAYRRSLDLDMEMWKYAVLLKMPRADGHAGHVHRANANAFLMGVNVSLNSVGIRGPEVAVPKPDSTYRILVAGDSFTFGWGVDESATFSRLLSDSLSALVPVPSRRYETVNLGVGNYNASQSVARIRELGLALQPDLIVLAYFLNDAEPVPSGRAMWLKSHSWLAAWSISRVRRLPFSPTHPGDFSDFYDNLYRDDAPSWITAQHALSTLAEIGREEGIPIVMFLLPELRRTGANYPFRNQHRKIMAAAAATGLTAYDLVDAFPLPSRMYWVSPLDPHPNELAHQTIATEILRNLAPEFLLPSGLMAPPSRR